MTDKLDLSSPDFVNENLDKLAELFPNCVTEGADGKVVDFDLLKQELSHAVVEGNKERYRLEWPGKRQAIVNANLPTTKTLRPVREDSVDFDNTENLYIEGDNLEVLKLLQESYLGKIKMIYIDPPYNTGKDFVYKDNFSKDAREELVESGQKDEYNQRLVANPETAGSYHSDWLSMMYPRLKLARNLLKDDGVLFISLDDNEIENLIKLCDEIFGESNFVSNSIIVSNPRGRQSDTYVASVHDYLLIYAKDISKCKINGKPLTNEQEAEFNLIDEEGEKYRLLGLRQRGSASRREDRPDMFFPIYVNERAKSLSLENLDQGIAVYPRKSDGSDGRWMWGKARCQKDLELLVPKLIQHRNEYDIFVRDYMNRGDKERTRKQKSIWDSKSYNNQAGTQEVKALIGGDVMSFPKPKELIQDIVQMGASDGDIVLDFFSGSATAAHAVMDLNSRHNGKRIFIQVQLPESTDEKGGAFKAGFKNICEIGKERIRRAAKKIKEETNADIDYGFRVYRLDSSNMEDVYYRPQDYDQSNLDLFGDNVKSDRTADDLLAQVMLDWGLPLSLKIEQTEISGKKVFKVAENSLYACFDSGIDEEFAKAIAKDEPMRIVFKDNGFASDTAKVNVQQLLKQLSPATEMKVI